MKNVFWALLVVMASFKLFAGSAEDQTVLDALDAEFRTVQSVGKITYREGFPGCDLIAETFVVGNLGSGTTGYECELCILDAGNGFWDYDRDTIFCERERH